MAAAAGAYILWGVLPVYWKLIAHVPATAILAWRIVGSAVVLAAALSLRRDWRWLRPALADGTVRRTFVVTALLLGTNWYVYVWANNNGHMVEASLGYFVTPLVSIVLGLAVLRERLRPWQWLAVALAAAGVAYLVARSQGLLWVSLVLAFSFGTYGLLRKTASLGSLHGLSLEVAWLLAPAVVWLASAPSGNATAAVAGRAATHLMLAGAGLVTVAPLVLFAYGARRVTLVTLGILQYTAPTLQFLLGVGLYHEPFGRDRVLGFSLIWLALAAYSWEGATRRRSERRSAAAPVPG